MYGSFEYYSHNTCRSDCVGNSFHINVPHFIAFCAHNILSMIFCYIYSRISCVWNQNYVSPVLVKCLFHHPTPWKPELNTLRPRQNGRLFADDTFKRIFLNKNIRISIIISRKFVPRSLINNIPALVLIMAWRRPGDRPLSEPMMVRSLTHIYVTRPQWVLMNVNER